MIREIYIPIATRIPIKIAVGLSSKNSREVSLSLFLNHLRRR